MISRHRQSIPTKKYRSQKTKSKVTLEIAVVVAGKEDARRELPIKMSSICPFSKAAHDGVQCPMKSEEKHDTDQAGNNSNAKEDNNVDESPKCPFGYDSHGKVNKEGESVVVSPKCPFGYDSQDTVKKGSDSSTVSPKCPFGYDSQTFKLGPLSCVICQALLFESSKCVPCSHKFCKACISRFNDCPLCGADIEKVEPDTDLQEVVDRFIEGHARIKRSQVNSDLKEMGDDCKHVIYEDVSLERGAFLVQHAVRALRAQNVESAKARLTLCAEDIREQLERLGNTSELCSQLGAVLGMLGDCCRLMGDTSSAIAYYEESVEFLSKSSAKDPEVVHTQSVSLNKIGDLKYYNGDFPAARSYYCRSLDVRQNAAKENSNSPSQVVDVAVSLAKVADVDRTLGDEGTAVDGFQEAIKCLESLTLNSNETAIEKRRLSVLEFLHGQLAENEKPAPVSSA